MGISRSVLLRYDCGINRREGKLGSSSFRLAHLQLMHGLVPDITPAMQRGQGLVIDIANVSLREILECFVRPSSLV
jgi:hypothetical protein